LSAAHQALTSTTGAITAQSEALQSGAKALADGTQHVSETINQANATVTDLTQVRNWIEAGSARLGEVLGSLETTREALTAVSGVLEGSAGRYDVSATGFNDAVATLQSSMTKALDQSLDPVTRELREAVELMQSALATTVAQLRLDLTETTKSIAETLAESSASTIAAYSTASSGVNTVLEDHMDGVVDRLNGQLGALQRMVPDEISRLTQASVQSAKTLEKAVRQLEAVVGTVNEKSTASLKGQLESYDKAVAEIHQRLAGTLALWETRAESLETAVVRLSDAVDRVRVS
jgi:ABC-type transporter Mla subunit MlaD